ncbi:TolC family protein [Brevibacillus daliensis]|uniref:TolC family protein n=1 Tax=Brevibacillus daliensis TaxID=2892995 RepID=UPI001E2D1D64|nr:TolC family protein [Brevibacillus daliensis]
MNFPYSKQKWMALTIAAMVMTSSGGVAFAATPQEAKPEVKQEQPASQVSKQDKKIADNQLTVEKAIELTLANNTSLKKQKLETAAADITSDQVEFGSNKIKSDWVQDLGTAQAKYVQTMRAEIGAQLSKLSVELSEGQYKLGAEKAYYDLLHAQDELNLKKLSFDRSESQLKIANAAFDVGTRAKTEVLQAEAGLAQAKAALTQAEIEAETARLNLNKFMGVDLNKKWELLTNSTNIKTDVIALQPAIDKALKERLDVKQAEQQVVLAEKELKVIDEYATMYGFAARLAKNKMEQVKLDVEQTKEQVKVDLMQAHYQVDSVKNALDALKKGKEAAEENYRLSKLRFENGLATAIEVMGAGEELSKSESSYQQRVHQLNLAVMQFENAIYLPVSGGGH